MIDWILGWIHLLIIDYDIIAVLGIIFIYTTLNVMCVFWMKSKKISSCYIALSLVGITFFYCTIVKNSITINQVPFYIEHNGKHINIVKTCAYEAGNDNIYENCIFYLNPRKTNFKRNG